MSSKPVEQLSQVIDGLRRPGKTVFLTTHYMEEAEQLADRIAVLVDGRIVSTGTPQTLGARNRAAAQIVFGLPAGSELPAPLAARVTAAGGRAELATDRPTADLHALSGWALEQGIELADIEVRRPKLEDVYLDLTDRS